MTKVLLIDDDKKLARLLSEFFKKYNFSLTSKTTPLEGLKTLDTFEFDIILLDVMLPEMDGFEVCKKILFIYPYAKILAQKGLKNAISDVGVALYSLHSGFMAARVNVLINLNSIKDSEFNESIKTELDSLRKQEEKFYGEIENIFLTKL